MEMENLAMKVRVFETNFWPFLVLIHAFSRLKVFEKCVEIGTGKVVELFQFLRLRNLCNVEFLKQNIPVCMYTLHTSKSSVMNCKLARSLIFFLSLEFVILMLMTVMGRKVLLILDSNSS